MFRVFILVAFLTFFNTNYFYSVKRGIQNNISLVNNKKFNQLALFLNSVFNTYNLSPQNYIDRVYIEEITPLSPKFIQLIGKDRNNLSFKKNNASNMPCYYLFSMENYLTCRRTNLLKKKIKLLYKRSNDRNSCLRFFLL
jgi:hypothetical protein